MISVKPGMDSSNSGTPSVTVHDCGYSRDDSAGSCPGLRLPVVVLPVVVM